MNDAHLPLLLQQRTVVVPSGGWRGRFLLTYRGELLGYADHGLLHSPAGPPVASLRRQRRGDDGYPMWTVVDVARREIGTLVPEPTVDRRADAFEWRGTVRLAGAPGVAAQIEAGRVLRRDGTSLAELSISPPSRFRSQALWGAWALRFDDAAHPGLRVMCFGWLALAWSLQRAADRRPRRALHPRPADHRVHGPAVQPSPAAGVRV
jgi:hypothetical protein